MRPHARRRAAGFVAGLMLLSLSTITTAGTALAGPASDAPAASGDTRPACASATKPGEATCLSLIRVDVPQRLQPKITPHAAPTGFGYGPADLQNAYALPSADAGGGQTVAIVDAYDYPSAEADLAAYRAAWGLPPCTTDNGCFRKVNQNGQASPLPAASGSTGWATEEALDIDMVSAACPNCTILLVEADSPEVADLGTAVDSAVSLGARYVSNSYGAVEYDGESADEAHWDHPGVVLTASSGDDGYGVQFPSASPHVVSVGGTSLNRADNARGWAETAWDGAGSGCSASQPKPGWQTDSGCANRTATDVSAVADPATGVAVYDTYDRAGWLQVGGTSAAAPIIASVYALVGTPPATGSYPANYLYEHASSLHDVTAGTNGACGGSYLCTAGAGYDGPTGLGTPDGVAAFGTPAHNIVTLRNPGSQAATQDVAFSLQLGATDTGAGQTLRYAATGLPDGLVIDPASGLISGTPTGTGSSSVTATATDSTGAVGSATFTLAVASPVAFTGPGPQASYVGQPVRVAASATDAVAGRTVTYSATGLPAGVSLDPATGVLTGLPAAGYTVATVTGHDSAGRSNDDRFIWYVAPAQATARSGVLGQGKSCLDIQRGTAVLARCARQTWTVEPDGTIQSQGACLTANAVAATAAVATCTGAATQQWRVGSFGELVNPASGNCLTSAGTDVSTSPCTGASGQRWSAPAGPIVSAVTGMCADSGAGTTSHPQVWYCGNTDAQGWTVQTDGTVRVGGQCLTAAGADAQLGRCTSAAAQQWRVSADGALVAQSTSGCLADPGDNLVAGTRLAVEPCGDAAGQLWHLE